MSDQPNDGHNLAWGVDFDAPAPQRRVAWGMGSDAAPVRRGETPDVEETHDVPVPSWTPIHVKPETVDVTDAIDVPDVFHDAGTVAAPQRAADQGAEVPGGAAGAVDPFDAAATSAAQPPAGLQDPAPVTQVDAGGFAPQPAFAELAAALPKPTVDGDPFDIFTDPEPGITTERGGANPEPVGDVQPVTGEPADSGQTQEDLMTVSRSDADPALERASDDPVTGLDTVTAAPTAAGSQQFHLPAVADQPRDTVVSALAAPADDLSSMFDDEPVATAVVPHRPTEPGPTRSIVATGTDFASRKAALEAARAASSSQAFIPTPNSTDPVSQRYLNAERYYEHVDRILALGQSGNPDVQALLRGFRLTRDAAVDAAQRRAYQDAMLPLMQTNYIHIDSPGDYEPIFDMAYDELIGIGPLGPLWRDDAVTEIMVSGPDTVTIERDGNLQKTPVRFRDLQHLERTARDLSQRVDDRAVSRNNPLVTAQLPGARVQFAMRPVAATAGVLIVIRKFRQLFGMSDLLTFGSLDEQTAAFLCDAVAARATILVSGGTGSGKTTMINALSSFIPDSERVITIEDALELQLSNTHVESLLTKEAASGDDQNIIGQAELLRATLRMRPDRIIVGEIRDGRGCSVMLQAANTGHEGTLTTIHANTPELAVERMADLLREERPLPDDVAKNQVTSAINLVVQIVRKRGRRYVSAVSVVNTDRSADRGLTTPLFVGDFPAGSAAPVFRRAGSLGSDTELAQKMLDVGLDPTVWE